MALHMNEKYQEISPFQSSSITQNPLNSYSLIPTRSKTVSTPPG